MFRSASRRLLAIIMLVIFLAAGVFVIIQGFRNGRMQREFTETTAVITRIEVIENVGSDNEDEHHTYVRYTVDGREYDNELGEYSSSFKEGAVIKIKYDPADPTNIILAGAASQTIMFVLGTVAILISLGMGLKILRGY